jgi:hypothetical protein
MAVHIRNASCRVVRTQELPTCWCGVGIVLAVLVLVVVLLVVVGFKRVANRGSLWLRPFTLRGKKELLDGAGGDTTRDNTSSSA